MHSDSYDYDGNPRMTRYCFNTRVGLLVDLSSQTTSDIPCELSNEYALILSDKGWFAKPEDGVS